MENELILQALYQIIRLQEQTIAAILGGDLHKPVDSDDPKSIKDLIDSFQVRKKLQISESTLYRMKKEKLIKIHRVGRKQFFSEAEILSVADFFKK